MQLLKNAMIIDPGQKLHGKKRDILIKKGRIEDIKTKIEAGAKTKVFDVQGAHLSIGWLDLGVHTGDPGFEHRENLDSVGKAAAAGGYTGIACLPNTNPTIHSKSEVQYIRNNTRDRLVDFYPIGAVSHNCEGKDITEMYDMHHAGAVAFSDGSNAIQNNGLMMRALQYVKAFNGVILNQPNDLTIGGKGQMNEGEVSTSLGLKGIPDMAEELMVQRDLFLAEYTDSRVHIANVSTANSVDLIRRAKASGIKVTASVSAINLAYDDTVLLTFDSNYKVLPPLRLQSDIKALRKGLKDGIIDIIASNHTPLESEAKNLEFSYADPGIIALQTCYGLINSTLKGSLSEERIIECLALAPRRMLSIDIPEIKKGQAANFTIYHPDQEWTYHKNDILSLSQNTPFLGHTFTGKVLGVVNNGNVEMF